MLCRLHPGGWTAEATLPRVVAGGGSPLRGRWAARGSRSEALRHGPKLLPRPGVPATTRARQRPGGSPSTALTGIAEPAYAGRLDSAARDRRSVPAGRQPMRTQKHAAERPEDADRAAGLGWRRWPCCPSLGRTPFGSPPSPTSVSAATSFEDARPGRMRRAAPLDRRQPVGEAGSEPVDECAARSGLLSRPRP